MRWARRHYVSCQPSGPSDEHRQPNERRKRPGHRVTVADVQIATGSAIHLCRLDAARRSHTVTGAGRGAPCLRPKRERMSVALNTVQLVAGVAAAAVACHSLYMIDDAVTRRVVTEFLTDVRSGRDLNRVSDLMAPVVLAHQVQSEGEVTIERTPQNYAEHVREMLEEWGDFALDVQEVLVDGARAYVRLVQTGRHAPTGRTVRQANAIVYHVEDGRITQYWMQIDRAGLAAQLAEISEASGAG